MEAKLDALVQRLQSAAPNNLKTVVLYGSAVAGDFHEKSDLNILCVVNHAGAADLERLHPVAEWWTQQGNPAPLVFTHDELVRSSDIFAIELLDMKRQHRILLGTDFLESFEVPMRLHRLQVERELRYGWLRVRQAILAAPQKRDAHLGIMRNSVSAFCVLFRHALIALGHPHPDGKRDAVAKIAEVTGANPSGFLAILDLREGKHGEKSIDVEATLQTYFEFVEAVTNEVDRRLDVS